MRLDRPSQHGPRPVSLDLAGLSLERPDPMAGDPVNRQTTVCLVYEVRKSAGAAACGATEAIFFHISEIFLCMRRPALHRPQASKFEQTLAFVMRDRKTEEAPLHTHNLHDDATPRQTSPRSTRGRVASDQAGSTLCDRPRDTRFAHVPCTQRRQLEPHFQRLENSPVGVDELARG
jgi:hypothetical protein